MENFHIVSHKIPCQHLREYPRAQANQQEDILHLAVKQYIPKDNPNPQPGDVTIIGAHANGFPKELYEPMWDDLASQLRKNSRHNWRIRSIWIADVAHQGESGIVNEDLLGNDPSWFDHSRDLLHLINVKRDEMPRPIIGVGHSMGGAQLANLAYIHPRLFTTLVFIDPVIQLRTAEADPSDKEPSVARLSTFRRDVWPSLASAQASLTKSPFYSSWDPRVLQRWIDHGLRPVPTPAHPNGKSPAITLATPIGQEVFTFLRPNYEGHGVNGKKVDRSTHADRNPAIPNGQPFYRPEPSTIFARLPELRPSALYIFGGTSNTSTPETNEAKLSQSGIGVGGSGGRAEGRVKGIVMEGIGHLVAMLVPTETAVEIATWVETEMSRWRDEQRKFEQEWVKGRSLREKQLVDEKWKKAMGGPVGGGKKESKI